jgi:hypothetical protein
LLGYPQRVHAALCLSQYSLWVFVTIIFKVENRVDHRAQYCIDNLMHCGAGLEGHMQYDKLIVVYLNAVYIWAGLSLYETFAEIYYTLRHLTVGFFYMRDFHDSNYDKINH